MPKDFSVAIVGGGMCGILCALDLCRAGIVVDIFEAAPEFGEVGAGVGLGPNALRALDGLDVLDTVVAHAEESRMTYRPFRFLSGYGKHDHIYEYPIGKDDYGVAIYRYGRAFASKTTERLRIHAQAVHRPAFIEALMPYIDPKIAHFNKRCTSISMNTQRRHILHFEDGTIHEADLIIGGDGIKSVTRQYVLDNCSLQPLVFSNSVAYRALIPADTLKALGVKTDLSDKPICWVGIDKHIITFPIQTRRMINVVAFSTDRSMPMGSLEVPPPWVRAVSHKELLEDFEGWGDDVMTILGQMKSPSKWYIHCLNPPLDSYVREHVVLIGDSAHAMQPHLGAGVGQGFEDVFILCRLLKDSRTNSANFHRVLRAYDSARRPRANMVLQRSFLMGEIYESYGDGRCTATELRQRLAGMWEPVWHHDLRRELEGIVNLLYGPNAAL